jgi:hypothetical protein
MKRLLLILMIGLALIMVGCDELSSFVVESIDLDESTIPTDFEEGIDISKIAVIVTYENGNTTRIYLNENMIDPEEILKLTQAGEHTLNINVLGFNVNFNITIEETSIEYYQSFVPEIIDVETIEVDDPTETVTMLIIGKDDQEVFQGALYVGGMTNEYGAIKLIVVIDKDLEILFLDFLVLDQTIELEDIRANLQFYVGSNLSLPTPSEDLIAGVSGSMNTIEAILEQIYAIHMATFEVDEETGS